MMKVGSHRRRVTLGLPRAASRQKTPEAVHDQVEVAGLAANPLRPVAMLIVIAGRETADALGRLDEHRHLVAIVLSFDCGAVGGRPDRTRRIWLPGAIFALFSSFIPHHPSERAACASPEPRLEACPRQ
jgi:hypothetical protein